jgi:alcohol dehydrogenase (nicotinoprotein)
MTSGRRAAVVGCAVPTGWGIAGNTEQVQIGDTVVVADCRGVRMNAYRGAAPLIAMLARRYE